MTTTAIAVKPLEWNPLEAQTPFGRYRVSWKPMANGLFGAWFVAEMVGEYETRNEAKAAAQADYVARILSALFTAPPTAKRGEVGTPAPSTNLPPDVFSVHDGGNSITLHFAEIKSARTFRDTFPASIVTPAPEKHVVGFDPFNPPCPHCEWLDTNLGRQLDKKCELHQKIEDLQSDLQTHVQGNRSQSSMLAKICDIIRAYEDDDPVEVARERMAEIEALEQELDAPSPQSMAAVTSTHEQEGSE